MAHNPPDPGDVKRETIYSIFEDRHGILWLGTHGKGLSEFDPATGEFTYHQQRWESEAEVWKSGTLSNNWVHDVLEDPAGMLWIATQEGLSTYDRESGVWSAFQHDAGEPNSPSHNWVQTLHRDWSGDLWVGTLGGGLNRLEPATGTFTHYRERDGLANDIVLDILEGDDYLWIATANGLSTFDPGSKTFKSYDASDGLPINEFSTAFKSGSGELFFGGINGLISFYPDQIEDNAHVPPVVLTSLEQNGGQVEAGQPPEELSEVTFHWPDNSFEFGFAALNYTQPEKNQHAYMLEGFEDDWNHIGTRRFGRYTNLPGGSYTLRLKGSNNDGVWNEEGASIQVTIVPPFWQTWWFWGGVVLVLAAGAVVAYRLRVSSVEARSRELEGQVASRTQELSALNAVAAVVSRSLDLQRVLYSALEKTLEVMQIETGGIYLLQEGAGPLMLAAHRGLSEGLAAGIDRLEVGEGLSGRVVQSGEPLVVEDLTADPRLARQVVTESDFRSLAIAPLVSRAKVLGALFVMPRTRRDFSQQEVELLTSIGGQIGVAVENAQLYEHAQEVAVVEERQRLARDLHDAVTQTLFSTSLIAEVLPQLWERDPDDGRRRLEQVRQATRSALAEMRTLLLELRPTGLAEADLGDLLRQLADATSGRGRVAVEVEVDGVCTLPPEVHVALYRIAQEALNNVAKHARANQATVHLECGSAAGLGEGGWVVSLSIRDDGRGFDPDEIAAGHLGLGIMRERAEAIGSCLEVESEPGRGTEIAVVWPHSHKESRDQSEKHCY
jgi:signal transduction histidine kinase/streptogramin lyase